MSFVVSALAILLFANAVIAFVIAFYWQASVLLTLYRMPDQGGVHVPRKALVNPNSLQNRYGRFIAGDIFPELRQKWLKAIRYAAVSFLMLFLVAGILQLVAPDYLP